MTASLHASADGLSAKIQVGGVDKVIIGQQGITPESLAQKLTLATAQATTSGTSIDFTSIPSWVKRITVMFDKVSTTGTSQMTVRCGTSGGVATSGYQSNGAFINGTNTCNTVAAASSGFDTAFSSAAVFRTGSMTLTKFTTGVWIMAATITDTASITVMLSGSVSLTGDLDRVRITTVGGTDTFDNGSVNILYEG